MHLNPIEETKLTDSINVYCVALIRDLDVRCQESFYRKGRAAVIFAGIMVLLLLATGIYVGDEAAFSNWLPPLALWVGAATMVAIMLVHATYVRRTLNSYPKEATIERWREEIKGVIASREERAILIGLCQAVIDHGRRDVVRLLSETKRSPILSQLGFVQHLARHYPGL